jgi:hypothetical protein
VEAILQAVEYSELSDVILVEVCCLLLFFWLLLADSTHLTAVWYTYPYCMAFLAGSEISELLEENAFFSRLPCRSLEGYARWSPSIIESRISRNYPGILSRDG